MPGGNPGIATPLAAGYTLIGLPLTPAATYSAETLGQEINAQAGLPVCAAVLQYAGGTFTTHPVGTTILDFPIILGAGYFVRCSQPATWTVTGTPFAATSVALTLSAGFNLVALPLDPDPANPYNSLRAGTEIAGATQVLKYENGAFTTHPVGTTVNIFPLATGRGYFVRCASPTIWNVAR